MAQTTISITWDDVSERRFEAGLDRGVLYPRFSDPVPWNGLVSVDESGADSSQTYYMDGRPFLFLPKPKEFEASLKAYTYPDEFLPFFSYGELIDGMYLDSQQGAQFDLCYRTFIGNDVDGLEHGYKIHIVYNATVDLQSMSRESFKDQISPIEFQWNIKAVPQEIDGYRSSAHIIIDSRKIDPDRLVLFEQMLYGDGVSKPFLPTVAEIRDMITYGDSIIINDLGDGTWTAEGSSDNVYMLSQDMFEIKNVDGVLYLDDTYEINSTPWRNDNDHC